VGRRGVLYGSRDGAQGRFVKDNLHPLQGRPACINIPNVSLDYLDLFRPGKAEIFPLPRREIVQDTHRLPACGQGLSDVGADKTASSRNEMDHESTLRSCCCHRLLLDLFNGQLEGHDGPVREIIGCRYETPVLTDDGAHNGKAQAGA